jgi:hypothetical protein
VNEDRAFLAQPPDFQGIGLDDGLSMGSDDVLNAWQLFHFLVAQPPHHQGIGLDEGLSSESDAAEIRDNSSSFC